MSHPSQPSDRARSRVDLPTGPAAYVDEGQGPTVLLVHGLPGSVRDFRWLAPALTTRLRVIRIDLPGFGETPVSTQPGHDVESRVDYLLAFMDALELEQPIIFGHSMGGVYATCLADRAPDRLRAMGLISSPGLRPHRGFRRLPLRSTERILQSPRAVRLLTPLIRKGYQLAGFRGPYSDESLIHTLRDVAKVDISAHAARIRRLKVPALAAWTTNDPLIEADILAKLADTLPAGPRLTFPDGGHNPQKAYADQIAEALFTWDVIDIKDAAPERLETPPPAR